MFDIWHIGVPVRDLAESVRFYVTGLGFELLSYYGDTMAFVCPPGKAFTLEFMELKEGEEGIEKKPHHLAFECQDLDEFRANLMQNGFFKEIPEISPSNNRMRLFALKDPDGTKIQFYQGRSGFDQDIKESAHRFFFYQSG